MAAGLAQGGGAHLIVGAVGQQHHGVAGVGFSVKGIVEDHLGLGAQVDLGRGDHLFGQHSVVGKTGSHPADLDGHWDARIALGELQPHGRDHPVLGEAEGLGQGVSPDENGTGAPDGPHHRHAYDAGDGDAGQAEDADLYVGGVGRTTDAAHAKDISAYTVAKKRLLFYCT